MPFDRSEIVLTQGKTALVDPEDYERIMAVGPWHAARRGKTWYARQGNGGKYMHQLVTGWSRTDHEDRNGLNNRKSNLRPASQAQNQANTGPYSNNSSGHKGVHWSKSRKKWVAEICVNYKTIPLGRYDNLQDAIAARRVAEEKYQGGYAYPGLTNK